MLKGKEIFLLMYVVSKMNQAFAPLFASVSNNIENLEYYLSLNVDTITCNSSLVYGFNNLLNRYYGRQKEDEKIKSLKR